MQNDDYHLFVCYIPQAEWWLPPVCMLHTKCRMMITTCLYATYHKQNGDYHLFVCYIPNAEWWLLPVCMPHTKAEWWLLPVCMLHTQCRLVITTCLYATYQMQNGDYHLFVSDIPNTEWWSYPVCKPSAEWWLQSVLSNTEFRMVITTFYVLCLSSPPVPWWVVALTPKIL